MKLRKLSSSASAEKTWSKINRFLEADSKMFA
jgi:hypothetical protein